MDIYELFRCRMRVRTVPLVFGQLPLSGQLAVEKPHTGLVGQQRELVASQKLPCIANP